MKLIRATVYGFAKWHDFQLDFRPSELQIIYGENESGKSSLQQFILFMLFGLPPKKREFFRSKTSGKMGGMLTIYEESVGEYTIERVDEVKNGAARCLLPNGQETDEEWLRNRLHGITRETYQSIFSFDALDLTSLKSLKEADLGEILLGIGLTGSTDIYAVEKRLDARISELFKPFGKKPIINQQLEYLDDLSNKLQAFKDKEKTYQEKRAKLAATNLDAEELQTIIQEKKKRVSESEKVRQALPNLMKLNSTESQLAGYPNSILFPENGIKRWETVKGKILPLESELAVLRSNASSYNMKRSELEESVMNPETYGEAKQLLDTHTQYNQYVKEMKNLENIIKQHEMALKNELNNNDTDLNDISLSYQTENTWIQIYTESQQLRIDKENLNHEQAVQQKQGEQLEKTLHHLDDTSLTLEQVDELSNRIEEYNKFQYKEKENVQNTILNAIKKQKQKTTINLLVSSIIIGVLVGLYGVFQGYVWCYGVMVALIGVGIAQWLLGKRSIQSMERLVDSKQLQPDDLLVTLEEKEEAKRLLASHDEQLRQKAITNEKLQANKIEQIKWQERYTLTTKKSNQLNELIKQQYDIYPILETIDVGNWPTFYHTLKSLLQKQLELKGENQQLDQVKKNEFNLRDNVLKFFIKENWELKYKTMDTCFALLQEEVEKHDNLLLLLEQYKSWIETTEEQVNTMKQRINVFRAEQMNLMDAAEVKTEEQFYQKNKLLQEKVQTEAKKEELMEQLSLQFLDDKLRELTWNSLPTSMDIEERQKEYRNQLELAEQELGEKRKEQATINADLANMESSDEHSQTMHRYDLENAKLKMLVDKWAVLKSAKEMLVETKNNYRNKYMARIIGQTSDYFAILTNHAYTHVYAPTKDQLFQVEAAEQLRFTVNELSQGTKDQLYIALRIAIGEVMSETHQMPFIIDDAFVHFDEIRVENMMKLTDSIAKKRQVILFTCKKELINDPYAKNVVVLSESIRKN